MLELYERKTPRSKEPALTIQRGGKIGFNSASRALFDGLNITHVWIFYDPLDRLLGLRAARQPDHNVYKICPNHENGAGSIGASNFLQAIGWSATKPIALPATWNEQERTLTTTLPAEHLRTETGRKRAAAEHHLETESRVAGGVGLR